MTVLINPGSGAIRDAGNGWTNTAEGATKAAQEWLERMRRNGITDVTLLDGYEPRDGRWAFRFRHDVTGVEVELETHGVDDLEAYNRERIFWPRVYWNGSSTSDPEVEDWMAPGFQVVKTFRAEES